MPLLNVWAQKPYVELIIEPTEVEVGQPMNITVKANMQGEMNIHFPSAFEQGYNVMNGMEQELNPATGEMITFMYYSKSGSFTKAGKYTVGPAFIRRGNKVYKSNTVTVDVREFVESKDTELDAKAIRKPACGVIQVSKEKVYEGEAVCVSAKVLAKFSPTHYESYEGFKTSPTTEKHAVKGPKHVTVRIENICRQQRYVFEHDKQVIFPIVRGKLVLEPFEMTLQSGFDSYPIVSRKAVLEVMPLPKNAPSNFSGGVGQFTVESNWDNKSLQQGDIASVTFTIKGIGNLHDIKTPHLNLPEYMKLYGDPEVKEDYRFTEKGAEGSVSITYYVQISEKGKVQLPVLDFAYFDPKLAKYVSLESDALFTEVKENPDFVVQENTNKTDKASIEKFDSTSPAANEFKSTSSGNWVKWVGFGSPICVALLFLLWKRRKNGDEETETIIGQNEPSELDAFDAKSALNDLEELSKSDDQKIFFHHLSSSINEALSYKFRNESGWIIDQYELNEAMDKGTINAPSVEKLKRLRLTCQQCEYGMQEVNESLNHYWQMYREVLVDLGYSA